VKATAVELDALNFGPERGRSSEKTHPSTNVIMRRPRNESLQMLPAVVMALLLGLGLAMLGTGSFQPSSEAVDVSGSGAATGPVAFWVVASREGAVISLDGVEQGLAPLKLEAPRDALVTLEAVVPCYGRGQRQWLAVGGEVSVVVSPQETDRTAAGCPMP
jgi:hypothetical protein